MVGAAFCAITKYLEDSPSGLWRTLGKRVGCKPSGVRIPHPPLVVMSGLCRASFSFAQGRWGETLAGDDIYVAQ